MALRALLLVGVLFIDSPNHPVESYTLSQVYRNAWVAALKVDRVDLEKGVVVFERTEAISGRSWPERLRQEIRVDGRVPAELASLKPGEEALCFAWDRQFTLLVTFAAGAWYTSHVADGDPSWSRIGAFRPDLHCLFLGTPAELADAFRELKAGREIVVLCRREKKGTAVRFIRFHPERPKSRQAVEALDGAAAKLAAWPAPEAREALPLLREAERHADPLVRAAAARAARPLER